MGLPYNPLTRDSASGPSWELHPQTLIIGSHSVLACKLPSLKLWQCLELAENWSIKVQHRKQSTCPANNKTVSFFTRAKYGPPPSSSVVSGACRLMVKIRRSLQQPVMVMPSSEPNDASDHASFISDRMSTHRFNHCHSKHHGHLILLTRTLSSTQLCINNSFPGQPRLDGPLSFLCPPIPEQNLWA